MTTKTHEALQCLVRKTAAGETESPEDVLGKARARKPSALVHLFVPRVRAEQVGEAVGLAEAGGVGGIRAADRYPALRALFHVSGGAALGTAGGAALGGLTGNPVPGALIGLGLGTLGGAIQTARSSRDRTKKLTDAGLAGLDSLSSGAIKDNVIKALAREPSYLGSLVGTGPVHRGRFRALAAASGNDAETPLDTGLTVAQAMIGPLYGAAGAVPGAGPAIQAGLTVGNTGLNVYDTLKAKQTREALLSMLSRGDKGRV